MVKDELCKEPREMKNEGEGIFSGKRNRKDKDRVFVDNKIKQD